MAKSAVTRAEFDALIAAVGQLAAAVQAQSAPATPAPAPKREASRKSAPKGAVTGKSAVRHDAQGWWLVGEADVPAHCTGLKADGTGRCGETEGLDRDGRCTTHTIAKGGQPAPKGLIGKKFANAIRRAEKAAAPKGQKADGAAKVAAKPQRTAPKGPTCKGTRTNGEPCQSTVALVDGYCRQHADQAAPKGRRANSVKVA